MFFKREEIKDVLSITATTNDDAINAILKVLPSFIVDRTNNHFTNPNLYIIANTISFSDQTITDSAGGFITAGFSDGMTVYISGSKANDGYYEIDTVAAGSIVLKDGVFVTETSGYALTIYHVKIPKGLLFAAAQLVGYLLSQGKSQGIASESIGDYSVSYLTTIPDAIVGHFLRPYKKVKWV